MSRKLNVRDVRLTRADIRRLQAYRWPGNVSELGNIIERAVIASREGSLRIDLPDPDGFGPETPPVPAAGAVSGNLVTEDERRRRDREMIVQALEASGGKVFGAAGAAELLGIKPTTLASRMKRLGIEKPPRR